MVQPWVADQERAQQASWARYLSERSGHAAKGDDGAGDANSADRADPALGECAKCWPTRCPQCPWTPPPFEPGRGLDLAA